MSKVEIRPVDAQGRITLPKAWRNRHKTSSVVIVDEKDRLEIRPANTDLSRFIDAVIVDAEHFGDYHELRKELKESYGSLMPIFSSTRS